MGFSKFFHIKTAWPEHGIYSWPQRKMKPYNHKTLVGVSYKRIAALGVAKKMNASKSITTLSTVLLFCVAGYFLIVACVYYSQHHVIFQSHGMFTKPPADLKMEQHFFPSGPNANLCGWWMETDKAVKTILYFHGNWKNISTVGKRIRTFQKLDCNVFLIDYRGYGISQGTIKKEQDIYDDGQAALDYLIQHKKPALDTIIIWGRSLGGGVAAEISRSKPISAIVLESTFFSLHDIAKKEFWYFPTDRLLKFHFNTGNKLSDMMAPVIIIHSIQDRYIPFSQAEKLFFSALTPKILIKTKGAHQDYPETDPEFIHRLQKQLQNL